MVSVTKRGLAKSSVLKQVQATSNGILVVNFGESFDFKASLFYDSNGNCNPKTLRLNINRVCRIEETREYSTTCIAYCIVNLHEVPKIGVGSFHLPLVMVDCGTATGFLNIKVAMFDMDSADVGLEDTSSIGSDLSFMHKEVKSSRYAAPSKKNVRRVVGGAVPEAGKPAKFSQPDSSDVENLLTEMSIVKMHLDRAIADKETTEAHSRDLNRQYLAMETEVKTLKIAKEKEISELTAKLACQINLVQEAALGKKELELRADRLSSEVSELKSQLQRREEGAVCTENSELRAELAATKKALVEIQGRYKALAAEVERKRASLATESAGKVSDHAAAIIIRKDLFSDPDRDNSEVDVFSSSQERDGGGKTSLFSADDIDSTLRAKPTRTALFNDDVVELLKAPLRATSSHVTENSLNSLPVAPPMASHHSVSRRASGPKKPSLFEDD